MSRKAFATLLSERQGITKKMGTTKEDKGRMIYSGLCLTTPASRLDRTLPNV